MMAQRTKKKAHRPGETKNDRQARVDRECLARLQLSCPYVLDRLSESTGRLRSSTLL